MDQKEDSRSVPELKKPELELSCLCQKEARGEWVSTEHVDRVLSTRYSARDEGVPAEKPGTLEKEEANRRALKVQRTFASGVSKSGCT